MPTHSEYVGDGYSVSIVHCKGCDTYLGVNYPSDWCRMCWNNLRGRLEELVDNLSKSEAVQIAESLERENQRNVDWTPSNPDDYGDYAGEVSDDYGDHPREAFTEPWTKPACEVCGAEENMDCDPFRHKAWRVGEVHPMWGRYGFDWAWDTDQFKSTQSVTEKPTSIERKVK